MQNEYNEDLARDHVANLMSQLDVVLDREKAALLCGDLDGITRSLRDKEQLIDSLSGADLSRGPDIGSLHVKILHNQRLLDSALEGIRAVAERVSALRRIRDTLETYDQTGRKTKISGSRGGQVEKRA